jgi:hypothetical protein
MKKTLSYLIGSSLIVGSSSCSKEKQLLDEYTPNSAQNSSGSFGFYELNSAGYLKIVDENDFDLHISDTSQASDSALFVELSNLSGYQSYSEYKFTSGYFDTIASDSSVWFKEYSNRNQLIYWIANKYGIFGIQEFLAKIDFNTGAAYLVLNDTNDTTLYAELKTNDPNNTDIIDLDRSYILSDVIEYLRGNDYVWNATDYATGWGCSESKASSDLSEAEKYFSGILVETLYHGFHQIVVRYATQYEKWWLYCSMEMGLYSYVSQTGSGGETDWGNVPITINADFMYDPICSAQYGPWNNVRFSVTTNGGGQATKSFYRSKTRLHHYSLSCSVRHKSLLSGSFSTPAQINN